MAKLKFKKLNNQGSTFVLALLVITLLTTLALALANASIGNMMMKSIDRGSKKTFYTSETLMDEIRASVGYDSIRILADSYETVLAKIIKTPTGIAEVMNNDEANTLLKENYIDNVLNKITGGTLAFVGDNQYATSQGASNEKAVYEQVKKYIAGYIKGYDKGMAEVTDVGYVYAYKAPKDAEYGSYLGYKGCQWMVVVSDVSISYKENKSGETYFSNITTDFEIEYPNMVVDFTNTNRLTDFTDYALIADDNIVISGQDANVEASVYAGGIIDIAATSAKGAYVNFNSPKDSNINVICGGNSADYSGTASGTIRVGGSQSAKAEAHFQGVNIWCTNIATRATVDATKGAVISIGERCNTYVKDDLSIDAQKSNVSVLGEYYGYSYEGINTSLGHASSSAILVNGKKSSVTIGARKLFIGGRAYIDIAGASNSYLTGESLSLRASQEVYLVPAEYLGVNYDVKLTNPMAKDVWTTLNNNKGKVNEDGTTVEVCRLPDNYFANNYLAATPYTVRYYGNMAYIYFNFSDNDKASLYLQDVIAGKDKDMKDKLVKYNKNLFGGEDSDIKVTTPSSDIISTGVFMESTSGTPGKTVGTANMPEDVFMFTTKDLKNRYEILTHLLASLPWDEGTSRHYVTNITKSLRDLKGYEVKESELLSESIMSNIIHMNTFNDYEYNKAGHATEYVTGDYKYVKMAVKDSITVDEKIIGGIIICKGDVTLGHNFKGLIIAGGDIILKNDAQIINVDTNSNMIEEYIIGKEEFKAKDESEEAPEKEEIAFKEYFVAYKGSAVDENNREKVQIENVDYKDLVSFNNWRKYEDKTFREKTE